MDSIKTSSTSSASADADPIELRSGTTARLVFKPVIVHNFKEPDAAVNGCFVWQRKGKSDAWEDIRGLNLNSLKKGEGYALELHAAEILKLHRGLADLYAIHRSHGVPFGDRSFVEVEETLDRLLRLDDKQLAELPASSLQVCSRDTTVPAPTVGS